MFRNWNVALTCLPILQCGPCDNSVEILYYAVFWISGVQDTRKLVSPKNPCLRERLVFPISCGHSQLFFRIVHFRQRAMMKTVPHFLRGPLRNALKLALEEATWGNSTMMTKSGKLLPRMFLLSWWNGSRRWTKLLRASEIYNNSVGVGEWTVESFEPRPPEIMGFQLPTLLQRRETVRKELFVQPAEVSLGSPLG